MYVFLGCLGYVVIGVVLGRIGEYLWPTKRELTDHDYFTAGFIILLWPIMLIIVIVSLVFWCLGHAVLDR